MTTKISTTRDRIRDAVRSHVYRADTLGSEWEEVPYLHVDDLALRCAPGIDECRLSYVYGPICREDRTTFEQYDKLDLIGSYIKVVLPEATLEGDDITWYGVVELDDSVPYGSGVSGDKPRGRQRFLAYGLARLLERAVILSTVVDASQNTTYPEQSVTVEYGEAFNLWDKQRATRKGNRTTDNPDNDSSKPHWFSRTTTSDGIWTADQAVRYLLENHQPLDGNDEPVCGWELDGLPGDRRLSWYDPQTQTDGRTLKAVLDDLIPFRRGVSYTVEYSETDGPRGSARIVPFSFASEDVILEDDRVLPANGFPVELDFENALDVEARIVESVTTSYDEVVAIGHFATSTCTLAFGKITGDLGSGFQLFNDWTATQQQQYLAGASTTSGYTSLSRIKQYEANIRFRQRDNLRPVFRRWKLYDYWDGLCWNYETAESSATKYSFNPPWRADDPSGWSNRDTRSQAQPIQPYNEKNDVPPYAAARLTFEPTLPFLDVADYTAGRIASGDWKSDIPEETDWQYLAPLLFVITDNTTPSAPKYDILERLAEHSSNERQLRRWSATMRILPDRPSLEISVQGAPQHFLATYTAGNIEGLEPFNDPRRESGIDYDQMRATMCIRLPWRVQRRIAIRDEPIGGRPWRRLFIPVEARLDYVVPDTVVRINNGRAERSEGGFVRDDRQRLAQIAKAAARWYQTERQTLFFRIRGVVETVRLGQLVVSVGGRYTLEGINTPVTGIRYDLNSQTTELETSMAQVDFG